jgi:hypothetical protein
MTVAQAASPRESIEQVHQLDPRNGRVRALDLHDNERHMGVAMHLSPFAGVLFQPAVLAPLVLWLISKDRSGFNDDHGREIVNFGISFILLHVLLALTVIGVIFMPFLWIMAIVSMIRGAVAAGRGEYFRYPLTWRFLS